MTIYHEPIISAEGGKYPNFAKLFPPKKSALQYIHASKIGITSERRSFNP
jgi:hypothetical protein